MRTELALIVEDESIIALGLQMQLQSNGWKNCKVVFSGEKAITFCDSNSPDLIFMDISLQGKLNGLEAAQFIRKNCDTPIIFVSANESTEVAAKVEALSPSFLLDKPYSEEKLLFAINAVELL